MLKSGDVQDLFSHKIIIYSLKLSISFVFKSFFHIAVQSAHIFFLNKWLLFMIIRTRYNFLGSSRIASTG